MAETPPLQTDENGAVRVGGTRVTLDIVIGAYNDGAAPEAIVRSYDSLRLADVYAVIAYYLRHRAEVEAYLEERRRQAEAVRHVNEERSPAGGLRERLLARRHQSSGGA